MSDGAFWGNSAGELRTGKEAITVTPTLDTNAYASGDRVGSIMEFENILKVSPGKTVLVNATILDKAKQSAALNLFLFNALPTVASADNAALDISDTEMEKCIGVISFLSSDYNTQNSGSSFAQLSQSPNLVLKNTSETSKSIWGLLVSAGSPTYAVSSLKVTLHVME